MKENDFKVPLEKLLRITVVVFKAFLGRVKVGDYKISAKCQVQKDRLLLVALIWGKAEQQQPSVA